MENGRRHFIRKLLAVGAITATGINKLAAALAGPGSFEKIGINVNTVKKEMEHDYRETLLKIREMGYDFIEARPSGDSEKDWIQAVNRSGLDHKVMGYGLGKFRNGLDDLFRQADIFNVEYLVCYYPWNLPPGDTITRESALQSADIVDEIGKKVRNAGFRFNWHNHAWAFGRFQDGLTPCDILMTHTDPDHVGCELDIYWAIKAGADPVYFLERYPGRFDLLHIKDMDATKKQGITCVGAGVVDFKPIVETAGKKGCRHLIVEQERIESNGLDCARESLDSLQGITSNLTF
jgi:sugar phosphate isomerase/epimerase